MEVTRYQFSRSANNSEERVLAHFSKVSLLLEDRPDFPEELRGAKKGVLYITQYKMIFQHKDKGSTIIRLPLQLLEGCLLEDEPGSTAQCIKGTLTSSQGVMSFKFIFQCGAAECLNMIKGLSEAGQPAHYTSFVILELPSALFARFIPVPHTQENEVAEP
ncbi:UNVERIFIED_CONTAM: hypothetical protein K2H54_016117 [Gekko kuhli]